MKFNSLIQSLKEIEASQFNNYKLSTSAITIDQISHPINNERMKLFYGIGLFIIGQIMAWFQSNSGIITEENATRAMFIAACFAPVTTLAFAYGTKFMYSEMDSLWSIRFITFGIGYLIFIPLTWYFLGEEMLTVKNGISFLLCVALLLIQAFMK